MKIITLFSALILGTSVFSQQWATMMQDANANFYDIQKEFNNYWSQPDKKKLLEESIEPFFHGGEMVSEVTYDNASWNEVPHRFEAGTPNIAGAIGLGAVARFIMDLGWNKILKHECELTKYALKQLQSLVTIFGPAQNRTGVFSFSIPNIHPHDVSEIMNREQVAIRVGFHCAEPLHRLYKLPGSARISLGIYNTKADIDLAIAAIKKILKIFSV